MRLESIYLRTYFLYILVGILSVIFAYLANKRSKKIYLLFPIILLSLLSGLRGENVGLDTDSYVTALNYISNGKIEYAAWGFEKTFIWICAAIFYVFKSPQMVFILFSLLTNFLVMFRFWDFRKEVSLPAAFFFYYISFYFYQMNIMRQMCAVALVFFFSRYIIEGKYLAFIAGVILGFLFHRTAILGLGCLLVEFFYWKKLGKKQKIFLIIGCFGLVASLAILITYFSDYFRYFDREVNNLGLMVFAKLLLLFFASLLIKRTNETENSWRAISSARLLYMFSLGFTLFGYFFSYLDRVGLYFYIIEPIVIGNIVCGKNSNRSLFKIAYCCIGVYMVISALSRGNQGEIPYLFFWE